MKLPRIVWVVARTFGLGSAAVWVANSGAKDVEACVTCNQSNGHYYCASGYDFGSVSCYLYNNGNSCGLVGQCYSGE
jgi:hypothetical protein